MTNADFQEWLRHHMSKYPGLVGWLHKFPKVASEFYEPTRETVLGGWFQTLEHISLEDAKAATDRMKRGEADEPRGFGSHDTAVAKEARALRCEQVATTYTNKRQFIDGQEVVACLLCNDAQIPTIQVWSLISHRAMAAGKFGQRRTVYPSAVACSCDRGRQWAERPAAGRGGIVAYDPSKHVLYDYGDESEEALRKFVNDAEDAATVAADEFYGES